MVITGILYKGVLNRGSKSEKVAYLIDTIEVRMEGDYPFQNPDTSQLRDWLGQVVEVEGNFRGGNVFIVKSIKAA